MVPYMGIDKPIRQLQLFGFSRNFGGNPPSTPLREGHGLKQIVENILYTISRKRTSKYPLLVTLSTGLFTP